VQACSGVKTCEKLIDTNTGLRGGMGPPVTSQVDGKQDVALMGGGGVVPGRGGAPPPANAPKPVTPKLLVFALDGKAALPDAAP
jgi:hypothetical protein